MANLYSKIGDMIYDGLFTDTNPTPEVAKGVIEKGNVAVTYTRGTILEKDSSGKLHILGTNTTNNTPDCVLCDDVTVGTTSDETVAVYISGTFNTAKVSVASGYTITTAAIDALRLRNILLKKAQQN